MAIVQMVRSEAIRHKVVAAAGVAGGASVVGGAYLPWLTVFHGLRSYAGTVGPNGRLLAAGGAAAAALAVCYGVRPRIYLRYAVGMVGCMLATFSVYLIAQLLNV